MSANMSLSRPSQKEIGFREFVGLVAALMAMNALAIDAMLPALPQIGEALGIVEENQRQWVVTAYLLGFGFAQILWGTLSDRFGRRPILIVCLFFYIVFSAASALSDSFTMLMVARVLQGVASAAARVLAVSIVRDRYSGRQMARVMSLSFIVFLAVPILAPGVGQLILFVAPWQWIFGVLGIFGAIVLVWAFWRLPETLHPEYRQQITPKRWLSAWRAVVTDRMSVGYSTALALLTGSLFGFINSVQQIFYDIFKAPHSFPLVFAGVAGSMAVASFVNSRIVERLGTRRVSHWALIGFVVVASAHALVARSGVETMLTFSLFQAAMMCCFGLASANFGAMAMEPLGKVAGTASSVQGFYTTIAGSLLGFVIGQQFDGTTVPVTTGFAILGALALLTVFIAEGGKLFQPHHEPGK